MPALLQIGIHCAATEWPPAPKLAFLRSLKNLFKLRARIGVVENFKVSFDHGLIDDFGHDAEIIECVHRTPSLAPSEIAGRPAAIFGRTGLMTIRAKWIGSFGNGLDALRA